VIADWPLLAYSTGRLRADAWCAVGVCRRWDETAGAPGKEMFRRTMVRGDDKDSHGIKSRSRLFERLLQRRDRCSIGAGGEGMFRSSCAISDPTSTQAIWHFDHGDRTHGAAPLSVGKLLRAFADRVRDGVHRKGVVSREDLERLAEGSFPLPLPSAEGRHNAAVRESFQDR